MVFIFVSSRLDPIKAAAMVRMRLRHVGPSEDDALARNDRYVTVSIFHFYI